VKERAKDGREEGEQSRDTSDRWSKKFGWVEKVIRKSRTFVKCRNYISQVVLANEFVERLWRLQLVWKKQGV
jgi:hypothetical protein